MELLFGFRGAGPPKGHHGREVEGWAGQTGTDEDTGAEWQGCTAHTTHISSSRQRPTVPRGQSLWSEKTGNTWWKLRLRCKRYATAYEVNLHRIMDRFTGMKDVEIKSTRQDMLPSRGGLNCTVLYICNIKVVLLIFLNESESIELKMWWS